VRAWRPSRPPHDPIANATESVAWRWRASVAILLTFVAALYAAPFLAIGGALPSGGLVPLLDADTYLYAALARLSPDAHGLVQNPWYGPLLPGEQVEYLRFGRAIAAYGLLEGVAGARWSLGVWTMAWTLLIVATAFWIARRILHLSYLGSAAATLLIAVLDVRYVASDVRALFAGLDPETYYAGLPYRRPFFPQVGALLSLAYLGFLMRALPSGSTRAYAAMAVLQFGAALTFPYAALLCAGATAISAVLLLLRRETFPIRPLLAFGIACALADSSFYLLSGPAVPDLGSGDGKLIRWDPVWLSLKELRVHLVLLIVAAISVRGRAPPRDVAVGFGAAITLCAWSDSIFSPLQIGHHARYLLPLGTALLAIVIAQELARRFPRLPWQRMAMMWLAAAVAWASIQTIASYRVWRPVNEDNAVLYSRLQAMRLGPRDVVVEPVPAFLSARRPAFYWESSPLPLVSQARVLLTSGARFMLRPDEIAIHLDRLALYLHLAGHDAGSLQRMLASATLTREQYFLAGYGREFPLMGNAREQVLRDVAAELVPRMRHLDDRPHAEALVDAARVVVVDVAARPSFRRDRVDRLFACEAQSPAGPWSVCVGTRREDVSTRPTVRQGDHLLQLPPVVKRVAERVHRPVEELHQQ